MLKLSSEDDFGKALSGGGGGHSFKMNFGGKSADDIFKAGPCLSLAQVSRSISTKHV